MAKKNKSEVQDAKPVLKEDIMLTDLAEHSEARYLEYGISVIKGRAIPWIEDGLKPVQRRILFAMKELALGQGAKPKKSARVVGDVIGKYHPHGDSAVYEAMVRTSQSFSLRYPLVVGEGNFGSRDGDSPAAMRYTEARLSAFSDTFLSELQMGTVDWHFNYDNTMQEPHVLPARLPNILLNGGSGIGVGIATELPPHNLTETVDAAIAMIKNPKMNLDEVLTFITAPDYPTGGQIISSPEDIRKVYLDTKGSVRIRSRYRIENEGTRNWKIVFYELPQPTSSEKIMQEVDGLLNPKAKEKKGKKFFTPEQLRLKNLFSNLIETFKDLSDKDNPIRLVFEPKSIKQDPQELITTLLAYTDLEMNCPINLVVVGRDKTPRSKTLDAILREWTEFRIDTVYRRTVYEHDIAAKRLHILEGRLTILDHIEEVIQILRTADEPRQALMDRFSLSEIQAEDVMEIRLRQLARLEHEKILDEIKRLQEEIKRLSKLIESKTALRNQVIKELEADKKIFGDARRTLVEQSEKIAAKAVEEQAISDDPVTVAISERGWIRAKTGHQHTEEAFSFKSGDAIKAIYKAKLSDQVIFLDETGKSYSVPIRDLPSSKGGEDVPITTLADFTAKLAYAFVPKLSDKIVLASDAGYGFICKASDLVTRIKAGKATVNLDVGAKLLPPIAFSPKTIDPEQTAFSTLSTNGRLLCYRLSEINELAKGKGVALCGLDEGCRLAQIAIWPDNAVTIQIDGLKRPTILSTDDMAKHFQTRSSSKKGKTIDGSKNRTVTLVSQPVQENSEE
jgi:topoisomerase-4 subunit A